MTREEQRAKLIEMMKTAFEQAQIGTGWQLEKCLSDAIAALHGLYFINAVEVTEDMQQAGCSMLPESAGWADSKFCFEAMAAAGDLTKEPE